ncbi:MAG: hypothetical protein M3133_08525, partial [Actinomycetota bacterium]|nr:hypothetical protein [Actinomycetota bacterium]
EGLAHRAEQGGAPLSHEAAKLATEQAVAHRSRLGLENRMRKRLVDETGLPLLELPLLTGATFGVPDLEALAEMIEAGAGGAGLLAGGWRA